MIQDTQNRLRQAHCAVVGIGVSNLALIDFLLASGVTQITARDGKTREQLGKTADMLEARGITLKLGDSYLSGLCEDYIFRTPGIRPDLPEFLAAVQNGSVLSSEMELFFELTPATVIGITGSDGKTTTTTLTGLMLQKACDTRGKGRVFVGGNIGEPLLPRVLDMTADDFAVVELSSFQLQSMKCSPLRAAITNITPNHLNWHTDMSEYANAKKNIYIHSQNKLTVFNAENGNTEKLADALDRPVTRFSSSKTSHTLFQSTKKGDCAIYARNGMIYHWDGENETPILKTDDILLPGKHNLENYMTAIALTRGLVSADNVREVATTFEGVKHRLERIRTLHGVTYYNSSIDSSPTRTAAALSALHPRRPIVICGGYDKNIPFEPLAEALCRHAKAVVLTGATAEKIKRVLLQYAQQNMLDLPVRHEPIFQNAVLCAKDMAEDGDTVLLSPACASFDAFQNFAQRGDTFRAIVEAFE